MEGFVTFSYSKEHASFFFGRGSSLVSLKSMVTTYCTNLKEVCRWLSSRCGRMVGGRTGCFLQEQHSSEAAQVMLHPSAPSHVNCAFWSTAASQKQQYQAFLSPGCTRHVLVVSRCAGFAAKAWKETMSLTLEDVMFSTSLSHQWMYEPGEEFPDTSCMQWLPKMWISENNTRRKRGECHLSPAAGTLYFFCLCILFFSFQLVLRNTDFI